jgi:two-component system OmpR family sensor kinase
MKLAHQPLRVKLVALVLLLLTFAILLIGLASNLAMSTYLTGKVDDDLKDAADTLRTRDVRAAIEGTGTVVLPSDYVIIVPDGVVASWVAYSYFGIDETAKPVLGEGPEEMASKVGTYRTVKAKDEKHQWRIYVTQMKNGEPLLMAKSLSDVDGVKNRVFWTTVYGGLAVLILAATAGTELVRRSLRPLATIEKTAGSIAGGDLTRRVPDPEEGEPEPQTEVGSLARSLNSMLTQIEQAFTAQAASEAAARSAEVVARDAAEAAQVSEARARRSEEKMRQFVADASHELRTPLTTIRGFAELYRQGAVPSGQDTASLVKRIEDEARRMGLLVEDLLLLARMDEERPLRPGPVELRVLAMEAVQGTQVMAPDRKIDLVVAPGSGDLVVQGDDGRLRQVLNNLMTNAVAHTPAGTPVELRLAQEGEQAIIEVIDHGHGLDAEQAERVFERFYRADSARTRHADGHVSTGLGLAIVAALVAAHEGTVEVDSEPGEGATFRVRLPLHPGSIESL